VLALLVWAGLIAVVVFVVRALRSPQMTGLGKGLWLLGGLLMLVVLLYIGALSAVR
jgi:hypothetical protein